MHWECLNEWHYTQKCWCEERWWWYLLHLLLRHLIWLDQASLWDVVSGVAVSNLGCPGTNCMEPLLWVPCMSKELKSTVNSTEYFFFFSLRTRTTSKLWNLGMFLSLTWYPVSIRRAPGSDSCISLSNIWLFAEKTQVSGQKGSIRYSIRSPILDIHGMRLKSMPWGTLSITQSGCQSFYQCVCI